MGVGGRLGEAHRRVGPRRSGGQGARAGWVCLAPGPSRGAALVGFAGWLDPASLSLCAPKACRTPAARRACTMTGMQCAIMAWPSRLPAGEVQRGGGGGGHTYYGGCASAAAALPPSWAVRLRCVPRAKHAVGQNLPAGKWQLRQRPSRQTKCCPYPAGSAHPAAAAHMPRPAGPPTKAPAVRAEAELVAAVRLLHGEPRLVRHLGPRLPQQLRFFCWGKGLGGRQKQQIYTHTYPLTAPSTAAAEGCGGGWGWWGVGGQHAQSAGLNQEASGRAPQCGCRGSVYARMRTCKQAADGAGVPAG